MKRLIIFFIVFYQAACSSRTSVPEDIIPPDSMQKIMKDMIIAGQYSIQYIAHDSLKPDKVKASEDLMEAIFKIHHTTRAAFKKSLGFYESRPDLNKMIFDSLAADANRHRTELYTPRPVVKPVPVAVK